MPLKDGYRVEPALARKKPHSSHQRPPKLHPLVRERIADLDLPANLCDCAESISLPDVSFDVVFIAYTLWACSRNHIAALRVPSRKKPLAHDLSLLHGSSTP